MRAVKNILLLPPMVRPGS